MTLVLAGGSIERLLNTLPGDVDRSVKYTTSCVARGPFRGSLLRVPHFEPVRDGVGPKGAAVTDVQLPGMRR